MTAADSSVSTSDVSADSTSWLYIDDDGVERGPFSSAQMAAWLTSGYFSPDQPCKPVSLSATATSTTSFQPMSSCFPPAMSQQHTAIAAESKQQLPVTENGRGDTTSDGEEVNTALAEREDNNGAEEKEEEETGLDDHEVEDEDEEDEEVAARLAALKGSSGSRHTSATAGRAGGESGSGSGSEHQWHYVDDSGAVQGPFPTSHMRTWHAAGYFKPNTRVRRDDESELTAIDNRPHTDFIATPSSTAAVINTATSTADEATAPLPSFRLYTPDVSETDWYYTDRSGVERGPFSTSLMRHWHLKGYFTYNDCPIRAAHMPTSTSAPLRLQSKPPDFVLPTHQPAATHTATTTNTATTAAAAGSASVHQQRAQSAEQWLYIDSSGQQQGPFSEVAMSQWWRAGYLPAATQVKLAGEQQWSTIADRGQHCSFVLQWQQAAVAGGPNMTRHFRS